MMTSMRNQIDYLYTAFVVAVVLAVADGIGIVVVEQ